MLEQLHVKNLALIEEAEVFFDKGLNILTGETGAGKSILIGSVSFALGAKSNAGILREGTDNGFVELVFCVEDKEVLQALEELEIYPEDNRVILLRRIMGGRTIAKINGETVPVSKLSKAGELLIDIHGQHEHQSLLKKKYHLDVLDAYGREKTENQKEKVKEAYKAYHVCKKNLEDFVCDEETRKREQSFMEYEVREIEEANLRVGEDEELEELYKKLSNGQKIAQAVTSVHNMTGYESAGMAGEQIGYALRELSGVSEYDSSLENLYEQLNQIDALLNDFNREIALYEKEMDFSLENLEVAEERLNLLNHLKSKYGRTISDILLYKEEKQKKLEQFLDYEEQLKKLQEQEKQLKANMQKEADILTFIRQENAEKMVSEIRQHLADLNFADVKFEILFEKKESCTENGIDEVEFYISTNPGEPVKPLAKVASGGELSRIMLAIKTVLAERDAVDTLIFDEIDVGISGRTAQKVSEKMAVIGKSRQVLCITHLPQIAAMADTHFVIEKKVENQVTVTEIRKLFKDEITTELARMLGGAEITEAVLENAREMKELATRTKKY